MDELEKRAFAAFFRSAGKAGEVVDQPSARSSAAETIDGKDYVVLRNAHRTLAVYRVRNDGMLKRLKRWPADLDW